jgi:hypothetical protein
LRGLRNGGSQFVRVEHVHVDSFVHLVAAFRKGLSQSGYVEGQNVTIEFRWALNDRDQFFLLCCTKTTLFEGPRPNSARCRVGYSPLLMPLGELHGRNLASAFMRSRVHNRTSDRGDEPFRLARAWALPPVLPAEPSPRRSNPNPRPSGAHEFEHGGPTDADHSLSRRKDV